MSTPDPKPPLEEWAFAAAAFSSKKQDWTTPQAFFDKLNEEFSFTLDAAASHENAKCEFYLTEKEDSLSKCWGDYSNGGAVFANPPYGRGLRSWVAKAFDSSRGPNGVTVVMLIPARPDTSYWHDFILGQSSVEVRFVKGRLKFGDGKAPAPFPSAVVIFRPGVR